MKAASGPSCNAICHPRSPVYSKRFLRLSLLAPPVPPVHTLNLFAVSTLLVADHTPLSPSQDLCQIPLNAPTLVVCARASDYPFGEVLCVTPDAGPCLVVH